MQSRLWSPVLHLSMWACCCWTVPGIAAKPDASDPESVMADWRTQAKAIAAPLEKVRGVHPRLYLNRQRVAELRQAIQTTHAAIWKTVKEKADQAVRRGPPKYLLDPGYAGDEQLWQRGVGETMPTLAMAYILTGDKQYLDAARQWALASCGYKTWGTGNFDGMDLAAGHQLFGLAIVYDWCYDDLGEPARRQIRETLVKRTSAMFTAAATGKTYWYRRYVQNHLWVNACGIAAAGFALFDEVDDAACWIAWPLDRFQRTMKSLAPDGASHEGLSYWEYGAEYMLKFMELARPLLNVDLYDCPWWHNTASYAQYLVLPRNAWTRKNCIVDLADCPRFHWYGPDNLLHRLAAERRDGYAQWLATEVEKADVTSPAAIWMNLIWYDPTVPVKPPTDRPTMHHFDDLGIVSARTGWSGDESLLVFKCGPYIGHHAVATFDYDPGGGHAHPDANHFVLFGGGEWLVRDDSYRPKWTGQHNTLLIDGHGQIGEGQLWLEDRRMIGQKDTAKIVRAVSTPAIDQMTGDATAAYPRELGLQRFVRHVVFVKPDVLIVADEIAVDKTAPLELRFHPEVEPRRDGDAFLAKGKQTVLRIEPLTADGVKVAGESMPLPRAEGYKEASFFVIRLSCQRSKWRNAVALSWSAADRQPPRVALRADGERWTFTVKDRQFTLDWPSGKVE